MSLSFAALALLTAAAPERGPVHEALRAQCLLSAADPKNPWALAHGITGLGRDFAAADGRRAAEVIVQDFLQKGDDPLDSPLRFARFAPDQTPIEPHPNLLTKTLVLAGFPLSSRFGSSFGAVKLSELVRSVELDYRHVPTSEPYWRDVGWTLDLLADVHAPGARAHFTNGAKQDVDLGAVMDDALAYLEAAQAPLSAGLAKGLPSVPKDKQGIYSHSCGGLHFVQAVNHWARYPEVRAKWGERWKRQLRVLFYRLDSERPQYDEAEQHLPQYRLELLTQELKFYGHWLETVGRLVEETGYPLSASEAQSVGRAQALLDHAVRALQGEKAFESMAELKKTHFQTYLDLIGDSCHATHGLDYFRAAGPRR